MLFACATLMLIALFEQEIDSLKHSWYLSDF